ncbi:hypothetical protein O0L34_g4460 [Tuta absoluta]|nr:hypothetical protein O0L34_g4460 [Tuta absoluta]
MPGERSMRAVAHAALAVLVAFHPPPLLANEESTTTTTPIPTTPFDPSTRGDKKYGDHCSTLIDCSFEFSICDDVQKICRCQEDYVTNHVDKCGPPAGINESCIFNEQCEDVVFQTECKNERCACRFEMIAELAADGSGYVCKPDKQVEPSLKTLDPAMIGILVVMALMFIIICVVLRLFSSARWKENRTIFNTPNPRLMNVSLLKDSTLHTQDRRGSRISMRPPSRHASQQELRPHSPTAARHHQSHQLHRKTSGSRRGSRASSGHSATSLRSATLRSPTAPGPTSVTVEIRPPDA